MLNWYGNGTIKSSREVVLILYDWQGLTAFHFDMKLF